MREIIVNLRDPKAVEVFHSNHIECRMDLEDRKALRERERKIAHIFLDIALTGRLPKLVEVTLEKRKDITAERINDIQPVCQKVTSLMAEGLHAKVIIDMLRCATGGGTDFGSDFQKKFEAAADRGVRKDFWGTEYNIPLVAAEDLLVDLLERDVNVDSPTNDDLERSRFMKEFLTNYKS